MSLHDSRYLCALGQALLGLLDEARTFTLFHDADGCHVTYATARTRPAVRSVAAATVLDCLRAAVASPADQLAKVCQGPCGRALPLEAFPPDPSVRSGRKAYCRGCNNARRRPPRAA